MFSYFPYRERGLLKSQINFPVLLYPSVILRLTVGPSIVYSSFKVLTRKSRPGTWTLKDLLDPEGSSLQSGSSTLFLPFPSSSVVSLDVHVSTCPSLTRKDLDSPVEGP